MVTLINNGNLAVDIPRGGSSFPLFPFEFRMFVFMEEGKPEDPGKNSRSDDKNFRWHRESERCHIKKVIIFLLWLTSVRKLTFCFADRKQQFDSQLLHATR